VAYAVEHLKDLPFEAEILGYRLKLRGRRSLLSFLRSSPLVGLDAES
jgi:hypothetical protein